MAKVPQVGLHVSIGTSIDLSFDRALEVGCTSFQIFTRNPRTWRFKPLVAEQVSLFREKRKKSKFKSVVAHMPYLPNLATSDRGLMKVSRKTLEEEVRRCDALGIDYLVVHLGSHGGKGTMVGIRNVSEAVNEAITECNGNPRVLLENMAGQRNSVGSSFDELKMILEKTKKSDRVGVCLDSCHTYAAGFDLGGRAAVDQTMALFDESVGMEKLKVVHLNDSKGPLGSGLDRHENIGKGKIGEKGFKAFLHYPGISDRPLIMETPYDDLGGMKESVAIVRSLMKR